MTRQLRLLSLMTLRAQADRAAAARSLGRADAARQAEHARETTLEAHLEGARLGGGAVTRGSVEAAQRIGATLAAEIAASRRRQDDLGEALEEARQGLARAETRATIWQDRCDNRRRALADARD